jgi:hypothetical protein
LPPRHGAGAAWLGWQLRDGGTRKDQKGSPGRTARSLGLVSTEGEAMARTKGGALQRGRSGGRPASKRGRRRKRGPSGGGTLRRKSPQEGQRPSLATGRATSARSQRPRARHSGLMHCTVKPGRYCIASPQRPQSGVHGPPTRRPCWGSPTRDRAGTAHLLARILSRVILGVKRKAPQDIVVRLQLCKTCPGRRRGERAATRLPSAVWRSREFASTARMAENLRALPQPGPDAGPAKYYEEFR